MPKINPFAPWLVLLTAFLLGGTCPVFGRSLKALHGHVPEIAKRLVAAGRLPATNELRLAIGVPLRDPAGLDNFLVQLYDPASPNFQQYLTPEEFTARFGPTEAGYAAVKEFARTNGLQIIATHGNRLLLDVRGSVANVESAFHFHLRTYHHPTEARDFFAPDAEPAVDDSLPLADVSGLSDFKRPHPKSHRMDLSASATPQNGSGSGGAYLGNDFRNAYVPGTALTGAGQMVGLLEFDGFYSSDIAAYAAAAGGGRTNIVIQTVLLDGYNGVPTTGSKSGNGEVSLDIEMAMAMAPGLAKIVVFEAGSNGLPNDVLNAMVASNVVKNLSCSWGWGGGPTNTTEVIFQNMAAQGQSFFNASGDSDAFTTGASSVNGVDNPSLDNAPSSSPYITQVGGTILNMNGSGAAFASETNWNDNVVNTHGGYWGSSGGISSYYAIPSWQTNISMTANKGSTTQRNIPDVALTAANCYGKYGNGSSSPFSGTSAAAPLWAGFTALVNQQAALAGKPPVGFLNPAIYAIGKSASYTNCFHDITVGNNFWPGSTNNFSAVTGYDLCTGWGTPVGTSLINALAGPPVISPATGFVAVGAVGGPFSPASMFFSLTNSSTSNLAWSLVNTSIWLNASATNGTLMPNMATNFAVSLSAAADSLSAGIYAANVLFTNRNAAVALSLSFQLFAGQSLVQNGGFETDSYSSWTLADNGGPDQVDSGSNITPHTGTYAFAFGQASLLASLSQGLVTIPGQSYVLSFWLSNSGGGTTEIFQANWNTNATTTNTLYNLSNPSSSLAWTNLNFVVTAAGTNTTLQFAARNDPAYFGLDDVSVTPIPSPAFRTTVKTTNTFHLTWNTVCGLVYQVQYKTNLLQTNWINLGQVVTATTNTLTATDTNVITSPQRFYRLVLLP